MWSVNNKPFTQTINLQLPTYKTYATKKNRNTYMFTKHIQTYKHDRKIIKMNKEKKKENSTWKIWAWSLSFMFPLCHLLERKDWGLYQIEVTKPQQWGRITTMHINEEPRSNGKSKRCLGEFAIIQNLVKQWDTMTITHIMYVCIIFHDMIIEYDLQNNVPQLEP